YKIELPIAIDIFSVALPVGFCGALRSKSDAERIHGSRIKSFRGQYSHCNYSSAVGVDRVLGAAGLDVDSYRRCLDFKCTDITSTDTVAVPIDRTGPSALVGGERSSGGVRAVAASINGRTARDKGMSLGRPTVVGQRG